MSLTPGTRLGTYVIEAPLGVGGMGEVYRARDTRLHREVAIKVLPDVVASAPDRLARFEREAQLLAAFNHPHIAQIYGLVEATDADGPRTAIVMELVEGITLAERITQGAVPIDEALPIAKQIADAMDAAHELGIIHRDLKPANIKLTPSGTVKVLDFGLAKAIEPPVSATPDAANSPTFTSPATELGLILGTAAYMSPEQAKGKLVDKRADIWAFGCVLYEMLAGRRAFGGEETSDILAAILRSEVDWSALPVNTPATVRRLLTRCFERDVHRRLRDIGDARLELEAADREPAAAAGVPVRGRARSVAGIAILIALVSLVTALAVWRFKPDPPQPLRKLDVLTDPAASSFLTAEISPDGSRIVYVAGNRLLVRDFAQTQAREVGTAPDVTRLAWAPDSATIAYAGLDGKIRIVPVSGGAAVVVCDIPESGRAIGLAWVGGDLVIAVWRGSLYRVEARGGTPAILLALDPQKEIDFHALTSGPDGKLVFSTHRQGNEFAVEMLTGTARSALLPPMSVSHLAYSSGHLLYIRDESNLGLWAVPFDNPPLEVGRAFLVDANARSVDAASGGALLVGMDGAATPFELVAADRAGKVLKTIGSPAPVIEEPVLAPDGRHLLVLRGSHPDRVELWMHDLGGDTGTRLTFGEAGYGYPSWFPSGNRLVLTEHMETVGGTRLATLSTDGSGRRVELAAALRGVISPDGRYLVQMFDDRGAWHLRYSTLGADGVPGVAKPLFSAPEPDVADFVLSPDGHWLAYVERISSGLTELFVTRFPTGEGRWQPPMGGARIPRLGLGYGGHFLRWTRNSGELIFSVGTDTQGRLRLLSVVVTDESSPKFGAPMTLFEADGNVLATGYDVTPDGRTIVMGRRVANYVQGSQLRFVLVQPWLAGFTPK